FEVSGLSEVVVVAGPNGVGKSRLIASILEHLRNLTNKGVTLQLEATTPTEERIWKKKTPDTSLPADGPLLRQTLHQNQKRRKFQSNILHFHSDRSIQKVQPYQFSWEAIDPFDEKIGWDTTWS